MRKFLFLTMVALLSVGTLSAQSRALRDARRALQRNDLSEARTLTQQAANHPETANDPNLWRLIGDIGNATFDAQFTRQMLGQDANERQMFEGLLDSFAPYIKADSLGQIPDARGRVRNPVRRDITGIMRVNHQHLINAGIFFSESGNHARAADAFEWFWNIPSLPMFEGANVFQIDETFQIIKYYAVISALQADQDDRALAMMQRILDEQPFIPNDHYTEAQIFELMASTYAQLGNQERFNQTIQAGATRFPNSEFLALNYIHYLITNDQIPAAMTYINNAVANHPELSCELISVKGSLLIDAGDIEGAEAEFRRALAIAPYCESALESLARSIIVRAQEVREVSWTLPRAEQIANDQVVRETYQAALPLLETLDTVLRGRDATQSEQNTVLMLLRNVYYNLSLLGIDKSSQLSAVEARLPEHML